MHLIKTYRYELLIVKAKSTYLKVYVFKILKCNDGDSSVQLMKDTDNLSDIMQITLKCFAEKRELNRICNSQSTCRPKDWKLSHYLVRRL